MAANTETETGQRLPPPRASTGLVGWARANLFSEWYNALFTVVSLIVIGLVLWFGLRWVIASADWSVISVLGGRLAIGQYNTVAACADQNCFWRPQTALLLTTFMVGMGWGVMGGRATRFIAIGVAVVLALFAFLPYSFDTMGLDVRLLLVANLPSTFLGWAIGRYAPWGTPTRLVLLGTGAFFVMLALLPGLMELFESAGHDLRPLSIIEDEAGLYPAFGTDSTPFTMYEAPVHDAVSAFYWMALGSLVVTFLLALGSGITGNNLIRSVAVGAAIILALLAFLPVGLDAIGLDVRLLLVANLLALGLGWIIVSPPRAAAARLILWCIAMFLIALALLRGVAGFPGLEPVSVIYWGGLMLNILLAVFGIVISLPIGIALALGRRSNLPVVKVLCVVFIEVFRGVPLITLLFMSQVLVPLAFPEDFPVNSLMRAAIVITLFSAAYMAENVRGGLQALHPGQAEAARALGLPSWQTTVLISLPQAIRNVIPAIVGQFIALFKDTSLVYIIGMLDVVEISRAFIQGNTEYIASAKELFIFLALVFWIFTYGMSYVSRRIEDNLGVGSR